MLARWRKLVATTDTRGRPAHDARLIAVMEAFDVADLITLNPQHFSRFQQIRCLTPSEVMRQASA